MPIKDPNKRREYQRELMRKKRNQGLTKNVSPKMLDPAVLVRPENVSPDNSVSPNVRPVSPQSGMLDLVSPVRPEQKKLDPVSPANKLLDPPKEVRPEPKTEPCSRCPEIENSITNLANLYYQEQEKTQTQKRINQQLEKRIKELEKQPVPNNSNPQLYLLNLLAKHKQFAHTQRLYTPQETQEREFLDKVAKELINGLLGESQYSELKGGKHE